MPRLQTIDLVVLLAYVAGVVAVGCRFAKRSGTTRGFMAAGGTLPGWAVGLSIFGTYLSSNTFLGVPGKAYAGNWNAFVFSLSLPLAAFIAVKWFVPFYRRAGAISAYDHLELRFGVWARTYAVVCYLLTQIARIGTILFGVALGLSALTGWQMQTIIIATGVLVTLYTILGGIEAVIWTDVVQSIVLMGGALLVAIVILIGMPQGPAQAIEIASGQGKFGLGSFSLDWTTSTFWVVLLYGVFINLNNFGIDQSFVQRYHTAKSDRAAARSVWLGALLYLPISALFFFIGSSLFSFYQANPEESAHLKQEVAAVRSVSQGGLDTIDAESLADAEVADKAFPHFIVRELPVGLSGLLIAAIVAAAMSSIDTSLNSSATVILSDIVKRHIAPSLTEQGAMRVLRGATLLWGAGGTIAALAMIGIKSILDVWWMLSGVLAGGMLGLFLLGRFVRRAGGAAAAWGVSLGLLAILWMTFSPASSLPEWMRSGFHANMVIVIGTLTIFLVGVLVSRIRGGRLRSE